jgi:hypothetical protein
MQETLNKQDNWLAKKLKMNDYEIQEKTGK